MRKAIALAIALVLAACATYREDLNRGQRFYDETQYEHALAIWRVLEADMDSLSLQDQARYAYLRGMTDYYLKFRPDARHWLAIAKATDQEHPGGLNQEWKKRLEEALADLNKDVYGGGDRFDKSGSTFTERSKTQDDASGPSCASNTDCAPNQTCESGICTPQ